MDDELKDLHPVAPPLEAKANLMNIVRHLTTLDGMKPVPNLAGLSASVIARDKRKSTVTVLLQFAAGAKLPGHGHHGAEDSYVVSGSCSIDGRSFAKGDFHRIEAGTKHGDVVSGTEGCVLLITMDERDYRAA